MRWSPLYNNLSLRFAQNGRYCKYSSYARNFPKSALITQWMIRILAIGRVLIWRLYWANKWMINLPVCSPQDGHMKRYELQRSSSLWRRQEKCRKFPGESVQIIIIEIECFSVIPSCRLVADNWGYLEWSVDGTDQREQGDQVEWLERLAVQEQLCVKSVVTNQQKTTNWPDTKCKAEETSSVRSSRALFWGSGVRYNLSQYWLCLSLIA